MPANPRTIIIISLATVAAMLPACASTSRSAQAGASELDPIRARLESHGSLTKAQLVPLLNAPEGRETLARFAEEFDTVFYDGADRYAQIVRTVSSTEIPVLTFYFGWQHPDYTYPRRIMFMENAMDDQFTIDFDPESICVHVQSEDETQPPRDYTISWIPDKMAPWGYIFTETDRIVLND